MHAWLLVLLLTAAKGNNLEEAKRQFRAAETEYKLGRFDQALALFEKAYEAKPVPAFLFNIGQCHFNLGHYQRALFFYRGYLRDAPNVPNADAVQEQIAEANEQLDLERKRKQRAEEAARAREREQQPRVVASSASAASQPATAPSVPSAITVEPSEPAYKKWWLWTIVGVVVAGGAATAAVLLTAKHTPVVDWSKP